MFVWREKSGLSSYVLNENPVKSFFLCRFYFFESAVIASKGLSMISIQNFSSISVSADRVVVDQSAPDGPALKEANYTLKDKAIFFMSKIPLLKNTNLVKDHLEKLNIENRAALGVFLGALSKSYNVKGASAAAEALKGETVPLNARNIKQLTSVAQDYYGKGDAKPAARQVVVRIWPNTEWKDGGPLQGRVGHASVTVKNKMDGNPKKHINEHISWWPGTSAGAGKKDRLFAQREGFSLADYKTDKQNEIADRTISRLQKSEEAKARLKTGQAEPEDHALAKYSPRADQKKDKDGNWGVCAQKVYLPLVGNNKDVNDKKNRFFSLFGLNEKNIIADAKQAKSDAANNRLGYTLASKTENCASMAARMLTSGGSENFVKFNKAWISEDPNKVHDYAKKLQSEVDKLNGQAQNIDKTFSDSLKNESFKTAFTSFKDAVLSPSQKEMNDLKAQLQKAKGDEAKDAINLQIKALLDKQVSGIESYFKGRDVLKGDKSQRSLLAAMDVISRNAPNSTDDFNSLTLKAKEIVTTMDAFLKSADLSKNSSTGAFIFGNAMLDKVRDFMKVEV